jgi:hypothetical protein
MSWALVLLALLHGMALPTSHYMQTAADDNIGGYCTSVCACLKASKITAGSLMKDAAHQIEHF